MSKKQSDNGENLLDRILNIKNVYQRLTQLEWRLSFTQDKIERMDARIATLENK
jgi:hypothetical protein